jgi:hypothetical protein
MWALLGLLFAGAAVASRSKSSSGQSAGAGLTTTTGTARLEAGRLYKLIGEAIITDSTSGVHPSSYLMGLITGFENLGANRIYASPSFPSHVELEVSPRTDFRLVLGVPSERIEGGLPIVLVWRSVTDLGRGPGLTGEHF